jgi:hypothetical protein
MPLLLGDSDLQHGIAGEHPPTLPHEFGNEDDGIGNDDHSGSGLLRSKISASSSSVIPVSCTIRSIVASNRSHA